MTLIYSCHDFIQKKIEVYSISFINLYFFYKKLYNFLLQLNSVFNKDFL